MEPIETFKVDDKTVEIHYDEDPQNPREEDNCDTFICFHKRYSLGDKHNYKHEDYSGWDEMEKAIIKDLKPIEIRPLYLYDHSGITISSSPFSCPWDSGRIGFALITREQALKETNMTKKVTKKIKEWAKEYLTASISSYNSYLTGQTYGYIIKDADDNKLDSCWGYIGDIDYVREEATSIAKSIKVPPKPEARDPNQLELTLT